MKRRRKTKGKAGAFDGDSVVITPNSKKRIRSDHDEIVELKGAVDA